MSNSEISPLTGMSLIQANNTLWTIRGLNLPIGEALATGQLSSRDLAWAAENAYDERLKTASRTILFHRLGSPLSDMPKPLKLVRGSRYGEYKERTIALFLGITIGAMCAVAVIFEGIGIATLIRGQRDPVWSIIGIAMIPITVILWNYLEKQTNEAINYRHGRWGEEKVVDQLRIYLDGAWTIYHSFEWHSGKTGDVDFVLVGPKGIWALEVKAYSGEIRNFGDKWQKKGRRDRWANISAHPGKQVRDNSRRLQELLVKNGLKIRWVEPVVIWARTKDDMLDEPGYLMVDNPRTTVWKLETFDEDIKQLFQAKHSLSNSEIENVNTFLTRCVDEHRQNNAK